MKDFLIKLAVIVSWIIAFPAYFFYGWLRGTEKFFNYLKEELFNDN